MINNLNNKVKLYINYITIILNKRLIYIFYKFTYRLRFFKYRKIYCV